MEGLLTCEIFSLRIFHHSCPIALNDLETIIDGSSSIVKDFRLRRR
jgi:hypothetical protein